jgi:hypothetical protein
VVWRRALKDLKHGNKISLNLSLLLFVVVFSSCFSFTSVRGLESKRSVVIFGCVYPLVDIEARL